MLACGEIMSREELVSLLNRLRRVGCDSQAVEVKRAEKALPNRGTGIITMLESLRRAGLQPPRFEDRRTTFKVIATNATLLDEPVLNWLNQLRTIQLSDEQRTDSVKTQKIVSTRRETNLRDAILHLLRENAELSAQELADRLRVKAVTVRYHLRRLRGEGLIEPTTQKIKSPDVRYRLVKREEK